MWYYDHWRLPRLRSLLLLSAVLGLSALAHAQDITSNLVARWPMTEGTGTTLTDTSGNGRTLTFAAAPNAPSWLTGSANCGHAAPACVEFDTADGDVMTMTGFASGTVYTWATWIYPVTGNATFAYLLHQNGVEGFYYVGTGVDSNELLFDGTMYSVTALALNTWTHVAFTNNAGSWTWYVNGVSTATGTGAVAFSPNQVGTPVDSFNGRLKEMWMFARALTAGDIAALLTATSTSPVAKRKAIVW